VALVFVTNGTQIAKLHLAYNTYWRNRITISLDIKALQTFKNTRDLASTTVLNYNQITDSKN